MSKNSRVSELKEHQTNGQAQRIQNLVEMTGTLLSRIQHFSRLGYSHDGERDLYTALGYKLELTIDDYLAQYSRQDIAKAIINKPISATWQGDFKVMESNDDQETAFESGWNLLYTEMRIKSKLARVDKLAALGKYAVLLLGFDDVQDREMFELPVAPGNRKLIYLKPVSETNAPIKEYEEDPNNARYGLPKFYSIKISTPGGNTTAELRVHHSRIIHVPGEDLLENELESEPAMKAVFNRLKDLEKIVGGSGEMFWKGARPGYQGKADDDFNITSDTLSDMKDQVDEYEANLRRIFINAGIELKPLAMQVADPSAHVNVQLQMICAERGIPLRILVGSERGELASSQDRENWFDKIQARREEYAEPVIVRALIRNFVAAGVLPEPKESDYSIQWASLYTQSDSDKAGTGKTRSESLKNYVASPVIMEVFPPDAFYKHCLYLDDDDIELINEQREAQISDENEDFEDADFEEGGMDDATPEKM